VRATTTTPARRTGPTTDVRATGKPAPKPGSRLVGFGDGLGQMVKPVAVANACMADMLNARQTTDRDCTRQVAHVVRHLSVKGRHNTRRRVQGGVY